MQQPISATESDTKAARPPPPSAIGGGRPVGTSRGLSADAAADGPSHLMGRSVHHHPSEIPKTRDLATAGPGSTRRSRSTTPMSAVPHVAR